MSNLIDKIVLRYLWKRLQSHGRKTTANFLFDSLQDIGTKGMNIGYGGDISINGELYVINYLENKWKGQKGKVIFDVGANTGQYLRELSTYFKDFSPSIYSFEPSESAFRKIKENVTITPEIHLFNLGFSNLKQQVDLFRTADNSAIASVYHRNLEHHGMEMNVKETIFLERLDEFCIANNIEKIDFLKLDVEGHEMSVLQGADTLLKQSKIDYIQFEFGGCNIDSRTYFQDFFYFLRHTFHLFRIMQDGFIPLTKYNERMEAFQTTNFFAISKSIGL